MTKNKKIATKDCGKAMDLPNEYKKLNFEIELTREEIENIKKGHIPEVMEDHRFMYYSDHKFYIHRSWTGCCVLY